MTHTDAGRRKPACRRGASAPPTMRRWPHSRGHLGKVGHLGRGGIVGSRHHAHRCGMSQTGLPPRSVGATSNGKMATFSRPSWESWPSWQKPRKDVQEPNTVEWLPGGQSLGVAARSPEPTAQAPVKAARKAMNFHATANERISPNSRGSWRQRSPPSAEW